VATTIGAMRPTPAELDVARALIARVKAADPSIKRVDELLVCAAVGRMSGRRAWRRARHATLRSDDGQEQYISRPKQVTDWAARLEKLEQAPASESDSGLLVQPAWIEKNVPDVCATNSLVRKILACLCQVHRLLAADRGWGCASSHREAEGRRIPGSSRWLLTSTRGIAHCERVPSH